MHVDSSCDCVLADDEYTLNKATLLGEFGVPISTASIITKPRSDIQGMKKKSSVAHFSYLFSYAKQNCNIQNGGSNWPEKIIAAEKKTKIETIVTMS